jgi:POT family proton-dependent oligopeptide transporter
MMGLFFAASGVGNMLAARIGVNAESGGEKLTFTGIFIFCTLFALLIIVIIKPINRLMHKAENI